jgi:2-keto-4-pentenoate hydratase/2-oxohepta-3-ene-1,7-dioic acid hydratase in catechol pathway
MILVLYNVQWDFSGLLNENNSQKKNLTQYIFSFQEIISEMRELRTLYVVPMVSTLERYYCTVT